MDNTCLLGSHYFICIVYFIIHTPLALTFSFIFLPFKFNLFYTEFSNDDYGDCAEDAVDFKVKDGYTIIEEGAFQDCESLKTIKLSKSIKIINSRAFYNCSSLQKIDLPPSLTMLDDRAFQNCSSLQKFDLPLSLMTMSSYVFVNCSLLQKIVLPPSLTTLGDKVFRKGEY